jgi:hypothetical protein
VEELLATSDHPDRRRPEGAAQKGEAAKSEDRRGATSDEQLKREEQQKREDRGDRKRIEGEA